jgi:hypothetical protein
MYTYIPLMTIARFKAYQNSTVKRIFAKVILE